MYQALDSANESRRHNQKRDSKADVSHKPATKGANKVHNDKMDIDQDTDAGKNGTNTSLTAAETLPPRPLRPVIPRRDTSIRASPKHIRNVLLVDDNKINLQLLIMHVKKTGHTYETATNGIEALEAYKGAHNECQSSTDTNGHDPKKDKLRSPFDFVLMDVSMPMMDGLDSTRHIRSFERENNIAPTTIIALTGLASAAAQQEAYSSGVNTFMTKPVKLKELNKIFEKEEGEEKDEKEHKEESGGGQ